ncbi:acyltransferase [Bradyrhizobium frederickii]|uniref:Acyltransferase n=1 Tax=Bradyrhizobium frederickii TaxID=2560054 RepID=A0A4Y9KU52_9BRAD|nr:acyltransferase [Bradyrhizobium frederickii]TFV34870.1 acyltransferase [Bradyrhizobium frederickii]
MAVAEYRAFGAFRFVLAFTVVLSHTWFLSFEHRSFVQNMGIGNFAVMGFFVLSGFIISEAIAAFYQRRAAAFLVNRLLRLVPPYWIAVATSIVVHAALHKSGTLSLPDYASPPSIMFDPRNLAIQITGIFPIFNVNKVLPQEEWYYFVRFAWAIFVEFVFYLSAFVFLLALPLAEKIATRKAYLIVITIASLSVHVFSEYVRLLHTSFAFIPYFVLGSALYCVGKSRAAVAVAFVSYALIAVHFLRYTQGQLSIHDDWWSGATRPVVALPTTIMMLIPVIIIYLSKVRLSDRAKGLDQALGDLTYPLYLNHYAILVAALSLFPTPNPLVQVATVSAALLASIVLHRLVETPMTAIRNKIRGVPLLPHSKMVRNDDLAKSLG